jgi:hypothetical protein
MHNKAHKKGPFLVLLTLAFSLQGAIAQDKAAELNAVMERAAAYVARYEEEQLGNLLVTEEYRQNATFFGVDGKSVTGKPQRRLQSDFLLLKVGPSHVGVRKVNRVDGLPVKSKEANIEDLMNDSPEGILRRRAALRAENVRYDIGGVLRESNIPTYALVVARKAEAARFKFEKSGTGKVDGVPVWEVKFQEKLGPTLLYGKGGEPLFSSGTLWIAPESGRILKTDFVITNPFPKQKARGQSIVTYAEDKKLGVYVPTIMIERYETDESYVDCRADYSNFRAFNVVVNEKIGR